MTTLYPRPANLTIDPEPSYRVLIEDGEEVYELKIYQFTRWKRLSAIAHARYHAMRNPTHKVHVQQAPST